MARDSVTDKRLQNLKIQPNTIRGRIITWYAVQEHNPMWRIIIIVFLTIFVMCHTIAFNILLQKFCLHVSIFYNNWLASKIHNKVIITSNFAISLLPFDINTDYNSNYV